ncbi:MAG: hypothetical protein EKK64_02670 [Neisseriaceae bacterium]|nr:MAG: hypothetical protein EKK64_02670 [Neisseriaceae bacterium]
MELPKDIIKASAINPKTLIVYSKPKVGKTTLFANLKNNLIIDIENGSDYLDALKIKANNIEELYEIGKKIKEAGNPYQYITLDTVTALEEMVLPLALKMYKNTAMGNTFRGTNVLTLSNGAGYFYLREAFFKVINFIETLAPNIILLGHVKDKMISDNGELVSPMSIDLTGKIKSIVCANADSIGYLYRKNNQCIITFKTNDEVVCGSRCEHLKNQELVLSEMIDNKLTFYLNKLYI